jgi:hypothetical protein
MNSFTLLNSYYNSYYYNLNFQQTQLLFKKMFIFISFKNKKIKKIIYNILIFEFIFSCKSFFFIKKKSTYNNTKHLVVSFKLHHNNLIHAASFFFSQLYAVEKKYNFFQSKFNFFSKEFHTLKVLKNSNIVTFNITKPLLFDLFYNRNLFDLLSDFLKLRIKLVFLLNTVDPFLQKKHFGIYGFKSNYNL